MKHSTYFQFAALGLSLCLLPLSPALADANSPIYLTSVAELEAALVDDNAGRRLILLSGTYAVEGPLVVPDGVSLEGEGIMTGDGSPAGFEPGTETTIVAANPFPADLLTLGDGARLKGLRLEQPYVVPGNVVTIKTRAPVDTISASIVDCELLSDNINGIGPDGPIGAGVLVITRNPNPVGDPPPHNGSDLTLRMDHSIVRVTPGGNAVFGMNFSSHSVINISLSQNYLEGTLNTASVSRFDPTTGSAIIVHSERNLYTAPASGTGSGLQIQGGSGVPLPVAAPGADSNFAYVNSVNDRIEGFNQGVFATAGRRFNSMTGTSSGNTVDLRFRGLVLETEGLDAADFKLFASQADGQFAPGDDNILDVSILRSTGSGPSQNQYADSADELGNPLPKQLSSGNRLKFNGNLRAFERSNSGILPTPANKFFVGNSPPKN